MRLNTLIGELQKQDGFVGGTRLAASLEKQLRGTGYSPNQVVAIASGTPEAIGAAVESGSIQTDDFSVFYLRDDLYSAVTSGAQTDFSAWSFSSVGETEVFYAKLGVGLSPNFSLGSGEATIVPVSNDAVALLYVHETSEIDPFQFYSRLSEHRIDKDRPTMLYPSLSEVSPGTNPLDELF